MKTPIEILCNVITHSGVSTLPNTPKVCVDEVLVPEQCMCVYIGGKAYHVTIEEMPPADRIF